MSIGPIRVSWIDTGIKGSEENKYMAETLEMRQTNVILTIFILWRNIASYRKSLILLRIWDRRLLPIILPIPLEA